MSQHNELRLVLLALAMGCGSRSPLDVLGVSPAASGAGQNSTSSGGSIDARETGSSSSSGGSASGVSSSSGSSSGGSASSGGTTGGLTCMSAEVCPSGQVCCAAITMTTNCQAGPCPSTPIGPIQLCATSVECFTPRDTCGPLAVDPSLPIMVCNAPARAADSGRASRCGTQNCAGCCDSTGTCQPGTTQDACGAGGDICESCTGNTFCEQGALPRCVPGLQ
ncbi:MAG: hypothetical protein ACLP1X_21735 [Polyangiaceae bacterium]